MKIFSEGSVQGLILSDYGQSAGKSDQLITPCMKGSPSHDFLQYRDLNTIFSPLSHVLREYVNDQLNLNTHFFSTKVRTDIIFC